MESAAERLDYELEMGIFIGLGNEVGSAIDISAAEDHVFGLCLLNDWSARDIQIDEDGACAMLFRSEDEGVSWRSMCDSAHSPSRANIHGLQPDPDVPGGVVIGTDTGEVWRVNNDAEWSPLGTGMPAVLSIATLNS